MPLIENNGLKVISLRELLKTEIYIPDYQRPYRWRADSASLLFSDLYNAFCNKQTEYRVGTIILYYNSEKDRLYVVDGQQRLTTLSILLYCLSKVSGDNLIQSYSTLLEL